MKTTLIINDSLFLKIKSLAARQKMSLSRKVEALLSLGLKLDEVKPAFKTKSLPTFRMGKPKVDINDRNALYDVMEGR